MIARAAGAGDGSGRSLPVETGPARLIGQLRSSDSGLMALSVVVGAGAGLGAIVFRWLVESFTRLLTGYTDYAGRGHAPNPHLPGLGRWFVLFAPVVAGLIYGPLVHRFAREARGHGVPEVMYAVSRRGGRIPPQVAAVKALASALTIGGGGSVGREGPIVQIGSALGSTLGRIVRVGEPRMRMLVACGAAGGIAATFNAPLAGVFFAMELILRDFAAQSFGMVVLSSVTASAIGRAALGDDPFLRLPAFTVDNVWQYLLFAALGLLAGLVGVLFTKVLYWVEDACDWAWRGPEWARPAVGGLLIGAILLVLPQMYGVGYPVLGNSVAGRYSVLFLLVLLAGKILATSVTIGVGGSGGVFAPSLFLGAMAGAAYGQTLHHLIPGIAGSPGAYALIGMGAVFAGAARAPITAVLILFELTGEYTIILPLMAAIVLGTGISHLVCRDTIYSLKLRRRGVFLDDEERAGPLDGKRVADAMEPIGPILRADEPLSGAAAALGQAPNGQLPVLDAAGRYGGVITSQDLADALAEPAPDDSVLALATRSEEVRIDDPLGDALAVLDIAGRAVPVLDRDGHNVVGWLSHRGVLAALHAAR